MRGMVCFAERFLSPGTESAEPATEITARSEWMGPLPDSVRTDSAETTDRQPNAQPVSTLRPE